VAKIEGKGTRFPLNWSELNEAVSPRAIIRLGQLADKKTVASVMRADCAFGAFYRRQKACLGPAQATVATAHLIARVVYRMLKYQIEYEPLSMSEYEKQYHERQIKYSEKKAAQFGLRLAPTAA